MAGKMTRTAKSDGFGRRLAGDKLALTNSLGTKKARAMVGDSPAVAAEGGEGKKGNLGYEALA